jgi:hypothetical protein
MRKTSLSRSRELLLRAIATTSCPAAAAAANVCWPSIPVAPTIATRIVHLDE